MTDAITETRATYDTIAERYHERAKAGHEDEAGDVARFVAAVGPGGRVADVGCGPARHAALLRAAGLWATGLDLSEGQLRAGGVPGLVQADMRALPFATAALDGVWSTAALLHLPRALVPAVVAEFGRVTRGGGALHLVIAEGDFEGYEETAVYDLPLRRWFTYHDEATISGLLAGAGFTVTDTRRRSTHRDWLTLRATRDQTDPR